MPRLFARFTALACLLAVVNVAGRVWLRHELVGRGGPRMRVLAALPARDVDATDRFTLLFDTPVARQDQLQQPVERPPFTISPQPPGHWVWTAPDRLEYRLDRPLGPGRVFTVRPAAHVETQTGRSLVGPAEFQFQTRRLELVDCRVRSADPSHATFELVFNQPVDPSDLLRHLTASDVRTGSKLDTVAVVHKPAEAIVLRCERLAGHGGELTLGEPVQRGLEVQPLFELLRARAVPSSTDESVSVLLEWAGDLAPNQTTPELLSLRSGLLMPGGNRTADLTAVNVSWASDVVRPSLDRTGERTVRWYRLPHSSGPVMLYAERGVYRPGDAIHLTGLVRDAGGAIPPAFPLAITPIRPDGRELPERIVHFESVLVLDRERYVPGSTSRVLVRSPFAGTLWLTVETDRIVHQIVREMPQSSITLDLPVDAQIRGGAFVTASVVRAIDPTQLSWRPHRAWGMARLATDHRAHELPLAMQAAAQARPGARVPVVVQTETPTDPRRPGLLHLWAVDEGILLTTAFPTPHPFRHFYGPRKAHIRTGDLFDDLLPDHRRAESMDRIGAGDDASPDTARRNPMPMRRRDPAVVWRTAIPFGPDGRVQVELPMPRLTGEMRIMAVAVAGDRYGSAQQALTLTDPIVIDASWPRFLAPQDRFSLPVKLFNTTAEPLTGRIRVEIDGPVEVSAPTDADAVTLKPHEPTTVWLRATATGIGACRATVRAAADGGKAAISHLPPSAGGSRGGQGGTGAPAVTEQPIIATCQAEFPVRPAAALHTEIQLHSVAASRPITIEPPARFLPGTVRTTVQIAARPNIQLQPAIDDLIDYPYGCVEQTTSRLWALLCARRLLDARSDPARLARVAARIDAGIARLWSMQTLAGGIAYWPGSNTPDLWGTAYAASFLAEAKRNGVEIDARFANELLRFLDAALSGRSHDPIDDNTRALICRVLATFERPAEAWTTRLAERVNRLDMSGRADLAAAWLAAGRRDRAMLALPDDTIAHIVPTRTDSRFTSQVHGQAVLLSTLLDLDAGHPWITELVRRLEESRVRGRWGNTFENAAALMALARYQSQLAGPTEFAGTVQAGAAAPQPFDHAAPARFEFRNGEPVRIQTTGSGTAYVTAEMQGLLPPEAIQPYDRQLQVRRRWIDRNGVAVDPSKLRVGDLVFVELELSAPALRGDSQIRHIAVVDALPGGLEVENPRLATSARSGDDDSSGETSDPIDHIEFLDDRVVLFASAGKEPRRWRYGLRAISAGSFGLPPVQASSMYDAGCASLHGGGRVEIAR